MGAAGCSPGVCLAGTSFGQCAVPQALLLLLVQLILWSSTAAAYFSRTSGERLILSSSCCKTRSVCGVVFSIFRNLFLRRKRMCRVTKKKKKVTSFLALYGSSLCFLTSCAVKETWMCETAFELEY